MLIDDFCHVHIKESGPTFIQAMVHLKKDHAIFKGHFPETPIVPGVCMIQIVREVIEIEKRIKLRLQSADNIKFLSIINPLETSEVMLSLNFELKENTYVVQASLFIDPIIYFKFKGLFRVI